jgi:hypothetical protein
MAKTPTKATLQNSFAMTTPSAFERAVGNPAVVATLAAIERRADALKARTVAHAKTFEDRWTAKEGIHLWKRYLANQGQHPAPPNAIHEIAPEAVMKTAARNVSARMQRRLARINAIKTRMSNAVVRSVQTRTLSQRFDEVAVTPEQRLRRRRTVRQKP